MSGTDEPNARRGIKVSVREMEKMVIIIDEIKSFASDNGLSSSDIDQIDQIMNNIINPEISLGRFRFIGRKLIEKILLNKQSSIQQDNEELIESVLKIIEDEEKRILSYISECLNEPINIVGADPDGNCMYHAFLYGLKRLGIDGGINHEALRETNVRWMRDHLDTRISVFTLRQLILTDINKMLIDNGFSQSKITKILELSEDEQIEFFLTSMAKNRVYAIYLNALSLGIQYGVNVVVFTHNIYTETYNSGHAGDYCSNGVWMLYTGNHYDALIPLKEGDFSMKEDNNITVEFNRVDDKLLFIGPVKEKNSSQSVESAELAASGPAESAELAESAESVESVESAELAGSSGPVEDKLEPVFRYDMIVTCTHIKTIFERLNTVLTTLRKNYTEQHIDMANLKDIRMKMREIDPLCIEDIDTTPNIDNMRIVSKKLKIIFKKGNIEYNKNKDKINFNDFIGLIEIVKKHYIAIQNFLIFGPQIQQFREEYTENDKSRSNIYRKRYFTPISEYLLTQEEKPEHFIELITQLIENCKNLSEENDKNLVLRLFKSSEKDIYTYLDKVETFDIPETLKVNFRHLRRILNTVYKFISIQNEEIILDDNDGRILTILFTNNFLSIINKLNNEKDIIPKLPTGSIVSSSLDINTLKHVFQFSEYIKKINGLIQISDPKLETYLLKRYIIDSNKPASSSRAAAAGGPAEDDEEDEEEDEEDEEGDIVSDEDMGLDEDEDEDENEDEEHNRQLIDFLNKEGSKTLTALQIVHADRYYVKDINKLNEGQQRIDPGIVIEYISEKLLLSLKNNIKFRNNKTLAIFFRLREHVQLNIMKLIVYNCTMTILKDKTQKKIRNTTIKNIAGATHKEHLNSYFSRLKKKKFNLTVGKDLNFGIFNYHFTKLFLTPFQFPEFNMKQWIYLMNFNDSYTKLFIDRNKKTDLINRVRLIFKEMYMKKMTNIVVFDGHGRTIYLLIQFMYAYNYEFNIKVYEILKSTYLWHVDFFPSEPNENGTRLINIEGDIQNLINGEQQVIKQNLRNTLVYLNFCGIGGLHGLIFNFIKKFKQYYQINHSLWISSIVTKNDAYYLYKITPRSGDRGKINNFEKIAILLYISFLSSGKLIGTSDNIPDELIKTTIIDTLKKIILDNKDGMELRAALLAKINTGEDLTKHGPITKMLQAIIDQDKPDNIAKSISRQDFLKMLDDIIKIRILDKEFTKNVKSNTPEQRCILRRGGDKSLDPNRGYSFITFRIDMHRLKEFEKNPSNKNLVLTLPWETFFEHFRINFGFVPKYFFKYLKYKQKYLNLVNQLNNKLVK